MSLPKEKIEEIAEKILTDLLKRYDIVEKLLVDACGIPSEVREIISKHLPPEPRGKVVGLRLLPSEFEKLKKGRDFLSSVFDPETPYLLGVVSLEVTIPEPEKSITITESEYRKIQDIALDNCAEFEDVSFADLITKELFKDGGE